ncbi:MAG: hypothetical protein ACI9TI_001530 [Natronomonas sp.]
MFYKILVLPGRTIVRRHVALVTTAVSVTLAD